MQRFKTGRLATNFAIGIFKIIAEIALTIFLTSFIIIFAKSYFFLFTPQWFDVFLNNYKRLLTHLIHFTEIRIRISQFKAQSLTEVIIEPYSYTSILIICILVLSIVVGVLLSLFTILLPEKLKKVVHQLAFFLESIPDVVLIFSIQLGIIWIFKKSAVLLVNPIGGPQDVYLLPIIVTSILPAIMLFQITIISLEEEKDKAYVDFAYSKGLSTAWIIVIHIFRNVCVTVFSKIQFLLWFIISNLLITEYLFNMRGLFSFIYRNLHSSEVLVICLLMIFLPLYFLDHVGKWITNRLSGERGLV
ncbi:ABC transporter permease subunit [Rossellomorea vietnamensis]|uniref:ABC transporter permease subunit n=1 Tax=Rossellomorea aquimaris TaxID=189382 RepID=A0A5D4UA69_9BACI|nr:ABC transporter permease subunit [Rossellomorea aquimaris]TYS84275.1 ABC transporter permease subunit [Rossellomorea aquimaris]